MSKEITYKEVGPGSLEEQRKIYYREWNALQKEEAELRQHFTIARNMSCYTWTRDKLGQLAPDTYFPQNMQLLNENFDKLIDEISYKRYCLTMAFWPRFKDSEKGTKVILSEEQMMNFTFWDNRFRAK